MPNKVVAIPPTSSAPTDADIRIATELLARLSVAWVEGGDKKTMIAQALADARERRDRKWGATCYEAYRKGQKQTLCEMQRATDAIAEEMTLIPAPVPAPPEEA